MLDVNAAAQHWTEYSARFTGRETGLFWLENPEIHKHINRRVSGDPNIDWVRYTLQKYFDGRLPLTRCLSLGCGEGRLERTLGTLGTFRQCDAYDMSGGSIDLAKRRAEAAGFKNISYSVADVNQLEAPGLLL